jgi:poly(hydroxyalkanoate) depolymerase family esterase
MIDVDHTRSNDKYVLSAGSDFGGNPGALRMLYYIPDQLPPGSPLVVVLHGCDQTASTNAVGAGWLTLADRLRFALLCPEQAQANNALRCFNWFKPADARRDQGEAASIHQMVVAILSKYRDCSRCRTRGIRYPRLGRD